MSHRPKVTMIGIDAGDIDFIEQNAGVLPNMTSILAERPVQRLAVEPLSGAVWPTFMYEATPDVHGIYHHIQWDAERMRLRRTHPDWLGYSVPFWRPLAKSGVKVLAFDVPFLFRGDSGGAIEIANWGSHDLVDDFWCNDPATAKIVTSFAPRHPMKFEVPVDKTPSDLAEIHDGIISGLSLKTDLVCSLMDQVDSELFLVAYGETHRAGHILWPEPHRNDSQVPATALLDVYKELDKAVGRIADHIGPEGKLVLFALHGMASNQSQSHLSAGMLTSALSHLPGAKGMTGDGFGVIRALRRNVPASIQMAIARAVPRAVRDYVVSRELSAGYNWSQTPMISLDGDLCGYWRANIKGREKEGLVAADDSFLDDIAAEFMKFETQDNQKLVKKVHFPARDWPGARADCLPDILAEWNPDLLAVDAAVHPSGDRISGHRSTGRTGNHRFVGFCAIRGAPDAKMPTHIKELGALARELLGKPQA